MNTNLNDVKLTDADMVLLKELAFKCKGKHTLAEIKEANLELKQTLYMIYNIDCSVVADMDTITKEWASNLPEARRAKLHLVK